MPEERLSYALLSVSILGASLALVIHVAAYGQVVLLPPAPSRLWISTVAGIFWLSTFLRNKQPVTEFLKHGPAPARYAFHALLLYAVFFGVMSSFTRVTSIAGGLSYAYVPLNTLTTMTTPQYNLLSAKSFSAIIMFICVGIVMNITAQSGSSGQQRQLPKQV